MKRDSWFAIFLCLLVCQTSPGFGLTKLAAPPSAYDFSCGPRCKSRRCMDDYCPKPAPPTPCLPRCTSCDDYCAKRPPQMPCVKKGCLCDDYCGKRLPTVSCQPRGRWKCSPPVHPFAPSACGGCTTCNAE